MTRLPFLLLFSLFLAGCASTPSPDYIALVQANIVKGESTKDDVLRLFGKPRNKSLMDSTMPKVPFVDMDSVMPYEMWTYSWAIDRSGIYKEPGKVFPLFGTLTYAYDVKTVVFNFDRDGKVTGYSVNEATV